MLRRWTTLLALTLCAASAAVGAAQETRRRPNVVLIYADDLGNGDLGCYGHPRFRTPNIDLLAAEGARLTQFQSVAPNCTPSRAALMTGRYQFRSGLPEVLSPRSTIGMRDTEITLGEAFRHAGYATACVGKWHMGHLPQFLPTRHGFDQYFGIPYSNDMPPVALYEGNQIAEIRVEQNGLTRRYTERALQFIRQNREKPFFLYLAHAMPHKPLAASEQFLGKSGAGLYGDTIAELDWSVGEVLKALKEQGLEKDTLVLFSSDNGPWYGGSTGGLRGMKNAAYEGGVRVPLIARWPGRIPKGHVSREPAFICDLYTTALTAAAVAVPRDRIIDGKDIMPLLTSTARSPHEALFVHFRDQIRSVRSGRWKLYLAPPDPLGMEARVYKPEDPYVDPVAPDGERIIAPVEGQAHGSQYPGVRGGDPIKAGTLFDLQEDPSEQRDVSAAHPGIVERLQKLAQAMQAQARGTPSR